MNKYIEELSEKYKKNSRLSEEDKKALCNLIGKELIQGIYDANVETTLCEAPPEIAMISLANYLCSIEKGDSERFLKNFITSPRVQENKGGLSGIRVVFLLRTLMQMESAYDVLVQKVFFATVNYAYKTTNTEKKVEVDKLILNKRVVEQIRKSIIPLFKSKDCIIDFKEVKIYSNSWKKICKLFCESLIGCELNMQNECTKVYKWLTSAGYPMGEYSEEYIVREFMEKGNISQKKELKKENNKKSNPESKKQQIKNLTDIDSKQQKAGTTKVEIENSKKDISIERTMVSMLLSQFELYKNLKTDIDFLKIQIEDLKKASIVKNNIINEQKEKIDNLSAEKETMTIAKNSYIDQITDLEKMIEKLKIELSESQLFIDTVARNREKQSEEKMNKLASKLRFEYRDYCEAKELEMTIDLGENMRAQLGEVFSILEKNDIKLG